MLRFDRTSAAPNCHAASHRLREGTTPEFLGRPGWGFSASRIAAVNRTPSEKSGPDRCAQESGVAKTFARIAGESPRALCKSRH